ncbi:MAG: hypothetical protein FWH12_08910 [Treponema sp.]|nr:hypothetical protein [Treponema sp.]
MKKVLIGIIFIGLALPLFSQSNHLEANMGRLRTLSEEMGSTVTRVNSNLAEFDAYILDSGYMRIYTDYRRRYENLSASLRASEVQLNLMLRSNNRGAVLREERDNYADLIRTLEEVRNDYDTWLRSVQ